MILRGIDGSRRHELPHGNSWVTDEWHHLVSGSLALRSRSKSSWHHRWSWEEAWLRSIHGFELLLQLLFLCLQPLLLITQLVLLGLIEITRKLVSIGRFLYGKRRITKRRKVHLQLFDFV